MRSRKAILVWLLVIGLAGFAAGCKKKQAEVVPEPSPSVPAVEPQPEQEPVEVPSDSWEQEQPIVQEVVEPTIAQLNAQGVLRTVYFDFDKYDLSDEMRRTIQANADWLQSHSQYKVKIEGHCDERGTIEYNLALGERRAKAVRDYLTDLGVSGSRLRVVSSGEERPADPRSNEAAWAKNRRGVFTIEP